MSPAQPEPAHCPRCGADFHCGVNEAQACPCSTLQLGTAVLADLRMRFNGCLCLACLREFAVAGGVRGKPSTPA